MISYWLGELSSFQWVWDHNWEDSSGTWCLWGSVEKSATKVEECFRDVASDDLKRVFGEERYCTESSSFCSMLLSAMRRLYLRAYKKTMLSLHLRECLEWKCRSVAQSVSFLYRVVESLQSAPMWIFMSRKDIFWVECSKVNLIVGWRLLMKSFMDWSCLWWLGRSGRCHL